MNSLIEFSTTYTYLIGAIILGLFWLVVFFKKGANRKEMLITGAWFGVMAMILEYSFHDYWSPNFVSPYFLEDFLYGFFLSGICTQAYFFIFGNIKERSNNKHHPFFVLVAFLGSAFSFLVLVGIFKLNSIIPMILPPLFVGLYITYKSHHLLKVQIWTGFLVTLGTFVTFKILLLLNPSFVTSTWYLSNLSGFLVSGIPLEEYLFAFSFGFGLSLSYDYIFGRTLVFSRVK